MNASMSHAGGQLGQQMGHIGQQSAAQEPAPPTILEAATLTANSQSGALLYLLERMQRMNDRCFGPEPTTSGEGSCKAPTSGVLGALSERMQSVDALIAALDRAMTALERIA